MHNRSSILNATAIRGAWAFLALVLLMTSVEAARGSPTIQRAPPLLTHHLTKRSFFDIQCKGVYDKSIYARLDRICEDCYNLFREPQLHSLCKSQCFSTKYFSGCLEALLLTEETEKFDRMIEYLKGKRK